MTKETHESMIRTRHEWIQACKARLTEKGVDDDALATGTAHLCADFQDEENGFDVAGWDAPSDAADDELTEAKVALKENT